LIDLTITDALKLFIDDDNGVVLQDCIDISRAIDASLERRTDYSRGSLSRFLRLKKIRQYKKNR
jgi:ribosome maturation factor RimP